MSKFGEKKNEKNKAESKGEQVDLENHIILRLPQEVSSTLSEALVNGNLKDRMFIKLDNDLRYGEVKFDNWHLYAKVLDLPTIIECLKTIDGKNFYKSADICQLMICKEEQDEEPEKESPNKIKKKDPNKVDKKYLWPHGVTPPCKNVRKRRFRKTLKKKNVDAPEIEKEVKRLLRLDNDAIKVDFEIINEDSEKRSNDQEEIKEEEYNEFPDESINNETEKTLDRSSEEQKNVSVESDVEEEEAITKSDVPIMGDVGEHDIFGEELSSSEEDDDDERNERKNMRDVDESSRLSADDTRISSYSMSGVGNITMETTQDNSFNKSMFNSPRRDFDDFGGSSSNLVAPNYYKVNKDQYDDDLSDDETSDSNESKIKLNEIYKQLKDLNSQKGQKTVEYSQIQNATLRLRMQDTLDNLTRQIDEKIREKNDLENLLNLRN